MRREDQTGGPAFPRPVSESTATEAYECAQEGMTLRDYFAAQVDVSVYAPVDAFMRSSGRMPTINELANFIAEIRMVEADAMLAVRLK